jgi:hypothetical protein
MIELSLPFPPTTNNLYANGKKGRYRTPGITEAQAIAAYTEAGSLDGAAALLGCNRNMVFRRLQAAGHSLNGSKFSEAERAAVRSYYTETPAEMFNLDSLAAVMRRQKTSVVRLAREMGLTNQARTFSANARAAMSASRKLVWATRPHPRGFQGGSHTEEARAVIGRKSRDGWLIQKATSTGNMSPAALQRKRDLASARNALAPAEGAYSRTKHGRREDIGEMYFRSAWEANYARYLNWLQARGEIDKWEYEPVVFWFEAIKRGVRSYKPDFRITEKGRQYFVEVKGWMDPKSITKLKRMKRYHPTVEIQLVDERQYKAIASAVSRLIPGWEGRA